MSFSEISEADSGDLADLLGDVEEIESNLLSTANRTTTAVGKAEIEKGSTAGRQARQRVREIATEQTSGNEPTNSIPFASIGEGPLATRRDPMDDLFGPTTKRTPGKSAGLGGLFGDGEPGSRPKKGALGLFDDDDSLLAPRKQPPKSTAPRSDADARGTLTFLEEKPKPQASHATATTSSAAAVTESSAVAQESLHGVINRLRSEMDRLTQELSEQREVHKEELKTSANENKQKIENLRAEQREAIVALKENHRKAIEEQEDDHKAALERVKSSLSQEIETMASVFEHTKYPMELAHFLDCLYMNYEEVMSKVSKAVGQLESLSVNVTDMSDKSTRDREATLRAREQRVEHLQSQLEKELVDVAEEREKLNSILLKLELNLKGREQLLEEERTRVKQEAAKLAAEKNHWREEEQSRSNCLDQMRKELDLAKGKFLEEQQTLLQKVLNEEEQLRLERVNFDVQRDADVVRLREEAENLDFEKQQMQKLKAEASFAKVAYETKERRLVELEQALSEECAEVARIRAGIDRERAEIEQIHTQLNAKAEQLADLNKSLAGRQTLERTNDSFEWDNRQQYSQTQINHLLGDRRAANQHTAGIRRELKSDSRMERGRPSQIDRDDIVSKLNPRNAEFNAEKPFVESSVGQQSSSAAVARSGSLRSVLRHHAEQLQNFVDQEDAFIEAL